MSELRVALIAEGETDAIVIGAALKALLPRPFVLTQLQPEPIPPRRLGEGWGGVLRWCDKFAQRGYAHLETDPTLPGYDLFVVHIDADVTGMAYADYGPECANTAAQRGWPALPDAIPCPPPTGSVDAMRACLLAWTNMQATGASTVLCVPSKAVDAWLTAAVLNEGHALLTGLECNLNLEAQLSALPMAQRIKKTPRVYRAKEQIVTDNWATVRQQCTQAERFSIEVTAAVTV